MIIKNSKIPPKLEFINLPTTSDNKMKKIKKELMMLRIQIRRTGLPKLLACLRSITNESYLFGNFCCIILVYSVRSNIFSSVIPLGGQRVSYWSLNLHILLFKPTSSSYSFDPSFGSCSWSWSTLRHKYLPAKSIRSATRSHLSYSLNQLLFPADILKMIRYLD